jgi:hypothetical protein
MEGSFITPQNSLNFPNLEIVKHAGGRPKDIVWQYFDQTATKHPGHFQAKCTFCNHFWKIGVVKKLQVHLASECENVDEDIKNKFMHIVAKRDGISMEMELNYQENHTEDSLSVEQIAFVDRLILRAFIMCGIPFRIIENPYFINILKNLRSNYNPPSRERLSVNLLSEELIRVEIKINNILEREKNLTLGMKLFRIGCLLLY